MKRHLLALALLSSLPLAMCATTAMAQDHGQGWHDDDHGHDHHGRDDHGHGHDNHGWHDDHGYHAGWDRHYNRGEYLPERYRGREYYVDDYARYHLYAPPRGHRWVRGYDGQFVLVAVASGLIVTEMLGH
jgi:Ni/Co efflux regulator RcnB